MCNTYGEVLEYYKKKKISIFKALDNIPVDQLFDIDNSCLWNLGSHNRNSIDDKVNTSLLTFTHKFKCKHCVMLSKLLDINVLKSFSNPLHCSALQREIIITEYKSFGSNYKIEDIDDALNYISSYDENDEYLGIKPVCDNYCTGFNSRFIKLDPITNNVLINWYIEKIIPQYTKSIHSFFICSNNGYLLSDHFESIDIGNIPGDRIIFVLIQIFNILKHLEPYDFSIGDNPNGVFIIDKSYNVRLNDLSNCSITIFSSNSECKISPGIRIYSQREEQIITRNIKIERSLY